MAKKRRSVIKIYSNEKREEIEKKVLKALVGEKGTLKEKKLFIEGTLGDIGTKHYRGMNGTMIRSDYKEWGIPWVMANRKK